MPRMIRFTSAALAACALGAPALAVFTGIDLREDKGQIPPAELATIDPMGLGVRVINLYATFDGPGYWTEGDRSENAVVLAIGGDVDCQTWHIDKSGGRHADAGFHNDPLNGELAPQEALVSIFPSIQWDTFVGLSRKATPAGDADVTVIATGGNGTSVFADLDMDGLDDAIRWSWSTSNPETEQHVATFNAASNQHEVFLAQLTILGLDVGSELGQLRPGLNNAGNHVWESDIFGGDLRVFTQDPSGGAIRNQIEFAPIPAPHVAMLALPCALALARRSRCNR